MKKQFSSKQFKNLLNRLITESLEKNNSKFQDDYYDDATIDAHAKKFFKNRTSYYKITGHLDDLYLEKKEEMLNNGESFIDFYNNLHDNSINGIFYESLNFRQDVKSAVDKLYQKLFFDNGSLNDIMKYDKLLKHNINEMYEKFKFYLKNNNVSIKQWFNSLDQYMLSYLSSICPQIRNDKIRINKQ